MRVRLENARLCVTQGKRGSFIDLKVVATEEQMLSEFRMRGKTSEADEFLPLKMQRAKERLFSIVLAHRSEAGSVLAVQRHKLP